LEEMLEGKKWADASKKDKSGGERGNARWWL